jgi:hypothetical protein
MAVPILHRPAQPSEANAWAGLLMHGVRDETVIADIIASDEYFAVSQGN